MRRGLGAVAIAVALLTAGCADSPKAADGRLHVVASFYPLAEIAQRVGGGRVEVTNLTPAGVEPHDVELTSDDVDAIEDATLVLFAGSSFQPAIAKAAAHRSSGSIDLARGIAHEGDPHFWLDPTLMVKAVERALRAFEAADPDHAASFRANAEQFGRELRSLDERFASALAHCQRHELVTAHAAFGYLAARYGLTQQAVSGVSPEAEASPARLAQLASYVRAHGVTTVFYEELVPHEFATTLAKDAGVGTAVLNPLEGLTKAERDAGDDYLSVMGRNREALVRGLGCVTS